MLEFLGKRTRTLGSAISESRYRWELSNRKGVAMPRYAPSKKLWTAWRQGEAASLARDPFQVESRLLLPIILSESLEALLEASARAGPETAEAARLLDETAPIVRRDFARYVMMNNTWEDTFALWCVTRTPRVRDHLHSLMVALAVKQLASCPETGVLVTSGG